MKDNIEETTVDKPAAEDYSRIMNFIGQNLYSSLAESMEKLPPHFRNQKMVCNALSAFLVNVIYQQSSGNKESCQKMFGDITQIIENQLNNITPGAKL
ncbi:hypothetical protein [Legionella longbeachae]|uniref:Uncharacterized protein n=1 Tax=Legionella longbeachae serogroup 1 (strain NSW150) TaxID=661367 RepID=D3HKV3_LEGLN|nr:hypothetical protein [Legionella longbeachae]VEE03581.1 Uncharacterised protein [Legionella oakridgensis]HBD7397612.1 hypothetical protein [Legionella pneumophila]ARB93534.1 hypothetical protein A6J40_15725 [Legionella longbeachae]ARM33329.1 hypothetical protein B0B39_07250 [Legionella longbeachae]EEZ93802.1 conserved hypothetical protein [Legionella longbeachae D-4968]